MGVHTTKGLDQKDCQILNILQQDCRASLTYIAKQLGLSVDSTKKRLQKLKDNNIFHSKIQIRPRSLGFPNIVDIRIKLNTQSKEEMYNFIEYLKHHPRVSEVFNISGEYNMAMVLVAKDAEDLDNTTLEIKDKFGNIISSWNESTTLQVFKFETYDMHKLMGYKK